jgi:hypothetical protein
VSFKEVFKGVCVPHLFNRQFMRKDLVPPREVWLGILVLGITVGLCIGLVIHARTDGYDPLFEIDPNLLQRSAEGETLAAFALPTLELANWSPPRKTRVFAPDTLYEKINGRADFYLQYNFQKLTFANYIRDNDPELSIEVWAYDMGAAENARGVYQAEQSEHPDFIDVGQDGYIADGSIFFWKGPLYVNVITLNSELAEACLALARNIAQDIVSDSSAEWFKIALPDDKLVENSRGYEANDAFSLGFLDSVHTAEYPVESGGETQDVMHFIHQASDPAQAEALLKQYTKFFGEYGQVLSDTDGIIVGDGGGVIDAVFVVGRYLVGISDAPDADIAALAASNYRRQIQSIQNQLP